MRRLAIATFALLAAMAANPVQAIPVFARKYATSCQTCHTVYPKLTPFGEAFRRNGFRFPGVDSDYAKQETVTTRPQGTFDAAWVPSIPPLAIGFNGQAIFHPKKDTAGALSDNNASANLQQLIQEGHLWTGGTITDSTSFFGEVTAASDGTVDVEHAQIYFNDLIGPQHLVNVRVGRGFSNVTSFGPHSSFLADSLLPPTNLAALNGATAGGWNVNDHFNGVEVSGVVAGRLDYNVGWNAGTSVDVRSAEDVYGHVGFKLGGMRLDGEGKSNANPARPWEETALTIDVFAYHAVGTNDFGAPGASVLVLDTTNTVGGNLRAQLGSLELNAGVMLEHHKRAEPGGTSSDLLTQFDELSYIVVPWLVPAIRFEYNRLSPDSLCSIVDPTTGSASTCPTVDDWRLLPGVALLPYPNVKVVVTVLLESASGAPPSGSWAPAGGFATSNAGLELQNVQAFLAFAF
jgi:hypothetical protein